MIAVYFLVKESKQYYYIQLWYIYTFESRFKLFIYTFIQQKKERMKND